MRRVHTHNDAEGKRELLLRTKRHRFQATRQRLTSQKEEGKKNKQWTERFDALRDKSREGTPSQDHANLFLSRGGLKVSVLTWADDLCVTEVSDLRCANTAWTLGPQGGGATVPFGASVRLKTQPPSRDETSRDHPAFLTAACHNTGHPSALFASLSRTIHANPRRTSQNTPFQSKSTLLA